jgi:NAD(P)-dependent dehydrogenase (short-subunit alcohol dehydrogenase family)
MKVIITGATGFVGGAVLKRCIADSRIDQIVVLSRRDLQESLKESAKVTILILESFTAYEPEVLERLAGAQACLWYVSPCSVFVESTRLINRALGLKGAPMGYTDKAAAEQIDVSYPTAAARAFAEHLAPHLGKNRPFRFVLCSGIGAELDPAALCWVMDETRKLKVRQISQVSVYPVSTDERIPS